MIPLALMVAVMLFATVSPFAVAAQPETGPGAYEVLSVQEFDLLAGPARTAAHLSPDGTRFVHFARGDMCLYSLRNARWTQTRCTELDREQFEGSPEEMYWSPDGSYLAIGTFDRALRFLEDTDIRVLDVETGAIINLTDDGTESGLLTLVGAANLDVSPRWLDADTLVFIRYASDPQAPSDANWNDAFLPPVLMQIDVTTDGNSEAEVIAQLPDEGLYRTYLLALDPARGSAAVNLDLIPDDGGTNLLRVALDDSEIAPFAAGPVDYGYLGQITFSADGQFLLVTVSDEAANPTMQLVSTVSGQMFDIDPTFPSGAEEPRMIEAGWSPDGSSLAYVIRDVDNPDRSGLYITTEAGKPGTLILQGDYFGTTCCLRMPITWAENDVIMIGRAPAPGVLLVQVGEPGS